MVYWNNIFDGETWTQFQAAGATTCGFSHRMRKSVAEMKSGDVVLCYMTRVQRWVGALEVVGPSKNQAPIYGEGKYPVRLEVKPRILLDAVHGVPLEELRGRVAFYKGEDDRNLYQGFFRQSPLRFREPKDGELIAKLLSDAERKPVARPVDPKKLVPSYRVKRKQGSKTVETTVTVPETDEPLANPTGVPETEERGTQHTEIQHLLLTVGAEMGFEVWVAKNDPSRKWNGQALGELPRVIKQLPTQFNDATNRTIERIDVLWLKGNTITAAFEIESTTAVYSGLLRMSDLLALQPNLMIKLYIVAPDDRRTKVADEIRRPTFTLRDKPLPDICGLITFSKLRKLVKGIRELGVLGSIKPDFLNKITEYFNEDDSAAELNERGESDD